MSWSRTPYPPADLSCVVGRLTLIHYFGPSRKMPHLVEAPDDHWAWLCGERPTGDWQLPEGGVDDPATLSDLWQVSRHLRSAGCPHGCLIVHGNEVVGLRGYKHTPQLDGSVEIGFGIAVAR